MSRTGDRVEEFLIEAEGRLIRILIEDDRGPEGAVPTLICRSARYVQILPRGTGSEGGSSGDGFPGFPGMPEALAVAVDDSARISNAASFRLDVSDLPSGFVPFSIDEFFEQVLRHVSESRETAVRLERSELADWGCELMDA
jgi:hypothetical protein